MSKRFFVALFATVCAIVACSGKADKEQTKGTADSYLQLRLNMVKTQIEARGIKDPKVLKAMREVPREEFVPIEYRKFAYEDTPLPIGEGQTISQPYIVALMTEALELKGDERVLEIGTGSGYQAAVLAEIVKEVYTIEILEPLYRRATETLKRLGYKNIYTKLGDGYLGWEEKAPFDAIIVTCSVDHVPKPLERQLRVGGRLIMPLGPEYSYQNLVLFTKLPDGSLVQKTLIPVAFVPMLGPKREPEQKEERVEEQEAPR